MSLVLDSDTCIRYLTGLSKATKLHLERLPAAEVKLCAMVKAELLYGAAKSRIAERTRTALAAFFAPYESLPFDDQAAEAYAEIRAAIAVSRSATLVTHNTREFARIRELEIVDWETEVQG